MESLIGGDKLREFNKILAGKEGKFPELEHLSVSELMELRQEIQNKLPASSLQDMDLEQELVYQFLTVKDLQNEGFKDDRTPLNQKAQVANSVAATLGDLVKMQKGLYTSERFKAIEALLIQAIKKLPRDVAEAFISDYEEMGR